MHYKKKLSTMKIEINVQTDELVSKIVQEVTSAIVPILTKRVIETDNIFTVETLAKYLQVSKQWVYERVHLKEIPYIKMGKFPRFRKSEIDHWLNSMKTPAMQPLSKPLKLTK
jgi:excisionase family DNA binding protein